MLNNEGAHMPPLEGRGRSKDLSEVYADRWDVLIPVYTESGIKPKWFDFVLAMKRVFYHIDHHDHDDDKNRKQFFRTNVVL